MGDAVLLPVRRSPVMVMSVISTSFTRGLKPSDALVADRVAEVEPALSVDRRGRAAEHWDELGAVTKVVRRVGLAAVVHSSPRLDLRHQDQDRVIGQAVADREAALPRSERPGDSAGY